MSLDRVVIKTPKDRNVCFREFEGQVGTVVGVEMDGRTKMYRVRLDTPVMVPGVGMVRDDLWSRPYLRATKR